MADTTTTNIKVTNQTEGGNNNSWGTIADANFERIDDKFGDVTTISTTGGTTTLTDTQELVNAIIVGGTLASNAIIVFSGRGGSWVVKNNTSGDYTVTCKVSGQDGVEIEQGTRSVVYCNGTDIESASGASNATLMPSGTVADYVAMTAPSGWVRCNGMTIGNASSGGTERANADTETLFGVLWSAYSNTILAIQDSEGTASSRGASAAADYAANKRLPLPDLRGRARFGLDDMGNSAAGRLGDVIANETTNGSSGGTETVTLSATHMPSHTHTGPSHTHSFSATTGTESAGHTHSGTTSTDGAHSHTYSLSYEVSANAGGGFASNLSALTTSSTGSSGSHSHTFTTGSASATHTHTVSGTTGASGTGDTGSAGGDTAHSNMPPAWLITAIIKL